MALHTCMFFVGLELKEWEVTELTKQNKLPCSVACSPFKCRVW